MLRRKARERLDDWRASGRSKALLVTGARQVGKTYLVERFAEESYRHVVKFDLVDRVDVLAAADAARSSEELFLAFSAFAGDEMVPGETLIFIDEVQRCKEAVTFVKYLVQREGFDYVLSGSLLGVELQGVRSLPVGYLDVVEMFPLDFEEFCWANGVGEDVWAAARRARAGLESLFGPVHDRLLTLFHRYLMVGGMPAAVNALLDTGNLARVKAEQDSILELYRMDVSRYARGDTLYVRDIFDQIPSQLSTQGKRFTFSSVRPRGTFDDFARDFLWLVNAGVALEVRNVSEPRHPLRLSENRKLFKLFMNDVGLLSAACGMEVAKSIVSDRLGVNYGAVYENAVAQELHAQGRGLYYFRSKAAGEVDFVLEAGGGRVLPVEVKSGKDYKRHSALDNVMRTPNYAIDSAVVLHDGNVERDGKVAYLPVYMASLL
ncbi:MAG: ATP-binding protein [Eggerthellaceae bacterium]|nr:ATP-binding protein [Eggerthellaceae bacterium]